MTRPFFAARILLPLGLLAGCSSGPGVLSSATSSPNASTERNETSLASEEEMNPNRKPADFDDGPRVTVLTTSVAGVEIRLHRFPASEPNKVNILLFAGIHGNEQSTVAVMKKFVEELDNSKRPLPVNVYVVPLANPDGFEVRSRTNANKVDLNRNFPAKNWKTSLRKTQFWNGPSPLSEPESRALHDLVLQIKPARILSLHSIRDGKHGNNYDGPASDLAALLSSKNDYDVLPTMGYPTPGSFGSWAGIDLAIPTITLELPSNLPAERAWQQNREALWAFVNGE